MKSNSIAPIEKLGEITQSSYELLLHADTPEGLLKRLPSLIQSLEKDKACKQAYRQIMTRLKMEDAELQNQKQDLVNWMINKLEQIEGLECSKFPDVKKAINIAKKVLSGKIYEINSGGYLSTLTGYFEQLCLSISRYGKISEFEDWLKISIQEHSLSFPEPLLKSPIIGKAINPFTSEGKQIIKRLNHGFSKASVAVIPTFSEKENELRYNIEWGNIDEIIYPDVLQFLQQNQNVYQWKVNLDQKAEYNLRYLLLLCQLESLKPIPLSALPKTNSIVEAEEVCNQQNLQYFLSCFRTVNWEKTPLSRQEIMTMVDRFLIFLKIEENVLPGTSRGSRSAKDDTREFVQENLKKEWASKEEQASKPRNYQELQNAVLKALKSAPKDIKSSISDTLILKEIRKFAKSMKWKPVRGKDLKKKRNIA